MYELLHKTQFTQRRHSHHTLREISTRETLVYLVLEIESAARARAAAARQVPAPRALYFPGAYDKYDYGLTRDGLR